MKRDNLIMLLIGIVCTILIGITIYVFVVANQAGTARLKDKEQSQSESAVFTASAREYSFNNLQIL